MKRIISILIMLSALSLHAFERGADRLKLDRQEKQRAKSSNTNAYYVPAFSNEIHRDTEVTAFRQKRNPKYKKDSRLTAPAMLKAKVAKSTETPKGEKAVAAKIWSDEAGDNELMLNLPKNLIPHTYIWYKYQKYKNMTNFDKEDEVKNLKKILTQ